MKKINASEYVHDGLRMLEDILRGRGVGLIKTMISTVRNVCGEYTRYMFPDHSVT